MLESETPLSEATGALVTRLIRAAGYCLEDGAWGAAEWRFARTGAAAAVKLLGDIPPDLGGLDESTVIDTLADRLGDNNLVAVMVGADRSGAWYLAVREAVEDMAIRLCGHDGEDREALFGPDGLLCDGCIDYAGAMWGDADAGAVAVLLLHAVVSAEVQRRAAIEGAARVAERSREAEAERRAKRAEQRRARRQGVAPAPSTPRPLTDPEAVERARAEALARAEANRQRLAGAFATTLEPGADRAEALRRYRQVAVEVGDVDGAAWAKQELRTLRTQGTATEAQTTGPDVGHYPKGS